MPLLFVAISSDSVGSESKVDVLDAVWDKLYCQQRPHKSLVLAVLFRQEFVSHPVIVDSKCLVRAW